MNPNLKSALYYTLLLTAMLGSTFGAGVLSVYASGVASSITMASLDKSVAALEKNKSLLQVRKRNLLEEFSGKNQKFHLVLQEYSGTSAFIYMVTDANGKFVKSIVIKKNGISVFAPYINDSTLSAKTEPPQSNQNPILNALHVRAKALRQRIESSASREGNGKL